jgi:hypothetical protein
MKIAFIAFSSYTISDKSRLANLAMGKLEYMHLLYSMKPLEEQKKRRAELESPPPSPQRPLR